MMDQVEQELLEGIKTRDNLTNTAIKAMAETIDTQDEPYLGAFWYDPLNDELFGIHSTPAEDCHYYKSTLDSSQIRTGKALHQKIWQKERYKGKDRRFLGNYTQIPRGRVFQVKDTGRFIVFTGNWIKNYPIVKTLILEEFQLPIDKTDFKIDSHWDIGRGWSTEF